MASTPTTEPLVARAGETWAWVRADLATDYPSSAWSLTYALRNAGHHLDIAATAEEDDTFSIRVAPAVTATYTPGDYHWFAYVSRFEQPEPEVEGDPLPDPILADRISVGSGELRILPDITLAAARDLRTWAKRMLDAVEAVLEARATTDQLDLIETTMESRGMKRDQAGLLTLRDQLLTEVQRETGERPRVRRILTRFA